MLEGLEISEVLLSELERTTRFDSEFYGKENLEIENKISSLNTRSVADLTKVSDGNHMSISKNFQDSGIPYYRGQNIHSFFIENSNPIYINRDTYDWPHMKRSHLKKGDVLLSIVGTIGGVSLVSTNNAATCNCKLAILRPKGIDGFFLAAFLKSTYGQNQVKKFTRGAVQMGLILEDMNQIHVPILSKEFQLTIRSTIELSSKSKDLSTIAYQSAENTLLSTFGLDNFHPSQEAVNVKNFSEFLGSSGRLDAEFYQPKYDDLLIAIRKNSEYHRIGDIRTDNFRGLQPKYVESGKLNVINSKHILEKSLNYENFEKTSIDYWNTQKRARVFKGDILTYTTGANIGRTQVYLSEEKALASNHVNILRLKGDNNSFYVGFVLNSLVGRMQTERFSAGSAQAELYPKDIDQFLIPFCSNEKQNEIIELAEESFKLKKQSEHLLEVAKTAVEIAIEQDEETALEYIKTNSN